MIAVDSGTSKLVVLNPYMDSAEHNLYWKVIDAMVCELCHFLREHHVATILTFHTQVYCTFVSALAKNHTGRTKESIE